MPDNPKAVVLLSGGLDSATTLLWAKKDGFLVYAISFRYGQRHSVELDSACRLVKEYSVEDHVIVDIDIGKFGGSALTTGAAIPKNRSTDEIGGCDIPETYVPARNTIFLSYALGWGEVIEAFDIFIGANAVDYSGYPDCRPEYLSAFEIMANLGTRAGVSGKKIRVHAPLVNLGKGEIVKAGAKMGLDFSLTHSCYDPDVEGRACGECDSCILRRRGFSQAGIVDPAV